MKKVVFLPLFLCFVLSVSYVNGQKEEIYVSSDTYIDEGIELHNKGEYDKAVSSYQKVSKCDPDYGRACYEIALSYYYDDKYEDALAKCNEAIDVKYEEAYVYSLIGSILDEMGRETEGIEILTGALKKWPYNQNILYNLAVCYLNSDQPLKAEETLFKSLLINPYHARTHLGLARVNYLMGRITQSYLAFNMLLVMSPTVNNLAAFEEAISQKPKLKNQEYKYPYPKNIDSGKWDDIKDLLQSELSFSENFDYNFKVSYMVTRQSLMLFRKLTFDPSDTSIYNRVYARFFVEAYNKFGFETYLNYILKNTNSVEVANWTEKNQGKLQEFVNWAQSFFNNGRLYGFNFQDEQNLKQTRHYDNDGNLAAIGEMSVKNGNVRNGDWVIIGSQGTINERGKYVNDKLEGFWLNYYPDGNLKKKLNYSNDLLEGPSWFYHPNGAVSSIINFKSDNRDGIAKWYTQSGLLSSINNYKNGVVNDSGVYYNYEEGFIRNYLYNLDTLIGDYTETWMNGVPKKACHYTNGDLDGACTEWYSNSVKKTEGVYYKGNLTGKYYEFYPNGQISREIEYDSAGNYSGKIVSYDRTGKITSVETEYKEGILNGSLTDFFQDGKKQRVITYKDNEIDEIYCYDQKENNIYHAKREEGKIYLKSFNERGDIESEGLISDNKREGNWKFYNTLGILSSVAEYSAGQKDGIQRYYYENGQILKEYYESNQYTLGEYKEYYISGHLKVWGNYDSAGVAGKWLYYYENDTISTISFFKKGLAAGRSFRYHPDGKPESVSFFDEEGNSIRRIEYGPDGNILADMSFQNGLDTFEIYFPNGQLMNKRIIRDYYLDGPYLAYYPNGILASKVEYEHRRVIGLYKSFDYHGNIDYEMPYINGLSEGQAKWYNDGKLTYTCTYEQNQVQGIASKYYSNGQKMREAAFLDDERTGNTDYYAPDGMLMYRIRYADNSLKAYTYKDKTGNFVDEIPITDTTTKIVAYYPNGNISGTIELYKGMYHGRLMQFYSNGTLLREATYKNNDSEGFEKTYFQDKKLMELQNFSFDKAHGQNEIYYPNGKKQMTGRYFMGEKEGEWKLFNPDGSLKETLYYRNGILFDIK